jgi:cytochrome c
MTMVQPWAGATVGRIGSLQISKSFLVLFFKKEQKERTSFLKKRSKKLLIMLVVSAVLPGAGASGSPNARGKLLFLRCASCHNIGPGPAKIGPNLAGVVGRKAGSLPGYEYSPAMKKAGFVWTEANLDRWLTRPSALVPGTAMAFAGQPAEADRQAIIAYLRQPAP